MANAPDSLPWSEAKQDAILGHLLTNSKFFQQCRDKIKGSWFVGFAPGKVWDAKVNWAHKHKVEPSVDELVDCPEFCVETPGIQGQMRATVTRAVDVAQRFNLEVLSGELTQWLKLRIFNEGMNKAQDIFNKGDLEGAVQFIQGKIKEYQFADFNGAEEVDWYRAPERWVVEEHELDDALTFGLTAMDHILLPEAQHGSLLLGDATVLLAPVTTGKTATIVQVCVANVLQGKHVLLVIHEGRQQEVEDRIWSCIMGVTKGQLLEWYKDPKKHDIIASIMELLHEHLTYVPMVKAGVTVEEAAALIRRKNAELGFRIGKGFDLVADDYAAILGSEISRTVKTEWRNLQEYVYQYLSLLANEKESPFHFLTGIQSNRTGSKIMNHQISGQDRLLTMEDVSESWGPMKWAANVITINRDPFQEAHDLVTYFVSKSRNAQRGFAVVCRTKRALSRMHSDDLGATWYRSTQTHSERLDMLLNQFKGQEVPLKSLQALEALDGGASMGAISAS